MVSKKSELSVSGADYRAQVQSLFDDTTTMMLGCIGTSLGILLSALYTGAIGLYVILGLYMMTGFGRWILNNRFHRTAMRNGWTSASARKWEGRYIFGSVVTTSLLGIWCIYSHNILNDTYASYTSVTVTFANLIGIAGRNFAISRLVDWQVRTAGAGVVISILNADLFYVVLAILLVPFILGVKRIAAKQRNTLNRASEERRHARKLAEQLDTALNNIPEGICMFDSHGRLEVANTQLCELFEVSRSELDQIRLTGLIDLAAQRRGIPNDDLSILRRVVSTAPTAEVGYKFRLDTENTRFVQMSSRPMKQGGIITTFEDISKVEQAANRINQLERYDRLTGLMNRDELLVVTEQELNRRSVDEECVSLLMNIDRFAQLNDEMGYRFGNLVLCELANRLESLSMTNGHVARYDGDEFAIVFRSIAAEQRAEELASRIIDLVQVPFRINDKMVAIEVSIGIGIGRRLEDDAELLMSQADIALSRAKSENRGRWVTFDRDMAVELKNRRQLENDLKTAIQRRELQAHFQPIVNAAEGRITVCEALMRWQHPERGFVSPDIFIPLAEQMGLITEIGSWMLEQACNECASWPSDIRVAVNLSVIQFQDDKLMDTIRSALLRSGLPAHRLEVEITESLLMENLAATVDKLNEIKALGVLISLDDFGTGYSSLSYVKDLPLDKLKIDRTFVMDLMPGTKQMALVEAVSGLGCNLGLKVVVEGVETTDQLNLLVSRTRVHEFQGYLFSKPLPASQIGTLLDRDSSANREILAKLDGIKSEAA